MLNVETPYISPNTTAKGGIEEGRRRWLKRRSLMKTRVEAAALKRQGCAAWSGGCPQKPGEVQVPDTPRQPSDPRVKGPEGYIWPMLPG